MERTNLDFEPSDIGFLPFHEKKSCNERKLKKLPVNIVDSTGVLVAKSAFLQNATTTYLVQSMKHFSAVAV